jgi:Cu+-exporting ATPase
VPDDEGGRRETLTATSGCNGPATGALLLQNIFRRIPVEKDVVCGMQVDPAKAAGTSEYNGKTYYFCSKGCKTKFDANPAQYAK